MLKNPILIAINDYRRTQIIKKIPELALCSHEFFLSIDKYLNHLPEKYFDKNILRYVCLVEYSLLNEQC